MSLVPIEMELYAQSPEACEAILDRLRAEGRSVREYKRFGLPQWIASLPETLSMIHYYGRRPDGNNDFRILPRDVIVDETWHWAPLKPGPDLYMALCRRSCIIPDPNYYYQDEQSRRRDIQDANWQRLSALIKHFTQGVDTDAFLAYYRQEHPDASLCAGATLTRALRTFLGGTVEPVAADRGALFLTALSVATGMPIAPELAKAGMRAVETLPAADREEVADIVRGTTSS